MVGRGALVVRTQARRGLKKQGIEATCNENENANGGRWFGLASQDRGPNSARGVIAPGHHSLFSFSLLLLHAFPVSCDPAHSGTAPWSEPDFVALDERHEAHPSWILELRLDARFVEPSQRHPPTEGDSSCN